MRYTCPGPEPLSLERATHKQPLSNGYGQFAAYLPVAVGSPIKQLLSATPLGG